MKAVLAIATLILVGVSGAALVPVAEPIRPYLAEATVALAVLVLILAFLQPRQKAPPPEAAAEPLRPVAMPSQAGRVDAEIVRQTGKLFSYASPESLVPEDHPLRAIRLLVNAALDRPSPAFAAIYAETGRPSIPPQKLLRALARA